MQFLEHNFFKKWGVIEKLRPIKVLLSDVDGTITDGKVTDGKVSFNVKDGIAISIFKELGIKIIFISGRDSECVRNKLTDLDVEYYLGIKDKTKTLAHLRNKYHLNYSQIAYIGDDINDIDIASRCSVRIAPKDAHKDYKKICNYVTKNKGGEGAIREIADLFRRCKNESEILKKYL